MDPLTAFINHVLEQQPWARERLRAHAGRSVRVNVAPLPAIFLTVGPEGTVQAALPGIATENGSHQGLQADAAARMAPDVVLSFPLANLPLLGVDPERALKDVRIEGDAEFAQTLNRLARELRWDAEEDLSRVVGDIAAHRIAEGARTFRRYVRDASQRLAETASAFLVDEDPLLVRAEHVERFARETAALRDDCARLEKRVERLEAARDA